MSWKFEINNVPKTVSQSGMDEVGFWEIVEGLNVGTICISGLNPVTDKHNLLICLSGESAGKTLTGACGHDSRRLRRLPSGTKITLTQE